MSKTLILIVDDSEDIRVVIEENILVPAGYEVKTVGDGLSALTVAHELEPDLVITDNQMPNLTGIELIRRLHRDKPHIPIILMTSEGSESLAVDAMRAGASDYLTKPFEAEQMLQAIERALNPEEQSENDKENTQSAAQSEEETKSDDVERRIQELEALSMIGRTVTSMLELDEVLTTVVEAAVRLSGAEEGSLLLLEEETGELYMRASKNFDEEFATAFRLHTQDSLAGKVIATGEPIMLDESTPKKIKTSYLVHSLIYVPLQVRGRVIGVLGVDNRKAGRVLTDHDLTVMMAMADYAAIAIENARLFMRSEVERIQLDAILRQIENGVIIVDPENRVRLINRAAKEAFSIEGEFLGKSVVEAFEEPKLLALLRSVGKVPRQEEIEVTDGRFFNAQRTPIEEVGQAIVMHNITHLKSLDRIKSEFVTTVSHDLRSPLTAILGYVELIERAGTLNDQQEEFVRRVRLSVQQITDLVTDLLDLGRIEAGLDIARESTPIGVLARYAVESLRGVAERKGVKLEANLPEELPLVNGDPIRLRQMIGNLLDNAIKYTQEDGLVSIEAEAEGEQVILRVSDTGPGIPPADQPYLFDKFFRASNIPDDMPGTGLGLSIVKSIVDNHGGRIWVDSKLGEGTVFTVVLLAGDN
ncbi:MAG: response regulator [Anaerolineales bacterium]|nr:response regulator [Anaerolineales bacterium]